MPFVNMILILLNSFQFRLVIAEVLFCACFPVRKGTHLILPAGITLMIAIPEMTGMMWQIAFYKIPQLEVLGFNFSFLIVFVASLILVALCFQIKFSELIFLGAGSFILQNLVYDVAWAVKIMFFNDINSYLTYEQLDYFAPNTDAMLYNCISVLILAVGYLVLYRFFVRRWNRDHQFYVEGRKMILFLIFTIILLNIISSVATNTDMANIYVVLLLAVCSVALLLIQFNFFDLSRVKFEKEMDEYMARAAIRQQKMSQEAVDLINIKAHDLKRSLEAIRYEMDSQSVEKELQSAEKAIQEYNAIIKTGNEALDTILTEKNLNCIQKKIEFTFLTEGNALDFMEPIDIFLLFGNALDNAIERLLKEEEENRIISLKVSKRGSYTIISIENYCSEQINFENGLPKTSKIDKNYHGFGMKSIRSIVEKYDGNMVVKHEDSIFFLNLLFYRK